MDFEDGLAVVQERGRAMQAAGDAVPSGMVSILGLEREKIEAVCDECRGGEMLEIANLLCPGNIVVSGDKEACRKVMDAAVAAGAMKAIPLAVAGAFHTPLMEPAVERLRAALADVPLQKPRIPVISNVDAQPHDDPEEIRELLDPASLLAGPLGRLDAVLARHGGNHTILRNRPRPRAGRPAEAHRPQDAVRKRRGLTHA